MNEETRQAILHCLDTREGRLVLDYIRSRADRFRIDVPLLGNLPNPSFMNEKAAEYRLALIELVNYFEQFVRDSEGEPVEPNWDSPVARTALLDIVKGLKETIRKSKEGTFNGREED